MQEHQIEIHYIDINEIKKHIKEYSFVVSILCHVLTFLIIKWATNHTSSTPVAKDESYVDFGYETFEEPPVIKPIETKAEEIQDEKSEVAGIQKKIENKDKTEEAPRATQPVVSDVPYYKIKPKYPREALESGVEGYVTLTLDVLEDGQVENIKVTGGEQVILFESAAKKAVAKWKYKPFLDAQGNAIKKINHIVRVDFKLQDELGASTTQ